MSLDTRLQRLWYGPAWRTWPLWPAAVLFGAIAGARRLAYRAGGSRERAGVPVIVVGNLSVGGTGKTPVVAWLAGRLGARGLRVGIVLRGFGGRHTGTAPRVVGSSDNPSEVGDEAVLHARRAVHVVVAGRDRVAAARLAAARGAEVVVSDDGLQHYRLARDYEIAVVDAVRGHGNGWLLPAGPLREPLSRLRHVDAIVVTSREAVAPPRHGAVTEPAAARRIDVRLIPGVAVNLLDGQRRPLASFAACDELHAVAGVGNPEAFFSALRAQGLTIHSHALPDHAALDPRALPFPPGATVLMTEKDAVKCASFGQPGWWWVDLTVEVGSRDADGLLASILERTGLARAGASLG